MSKDKNYKKELKKFDETWDYKKPHTEYFKERAKYDKPVIDAAKNKNISFFDALLNLFGVGKNK